MNKVLKHLPVWSLGFVFGLGFAAIIKVISSEIDLIAPLGIAVGVHAVVWALLPSTPPGDESGNGTPDQQ